MSTNQPHEKSKGKNQKLTCPEDIKPFYEAALAKGKKFIDS